MKKNFLYVILVTMIIVSFTGCNKNRDTKVTATPVLTEEPKATATPVPTKEPVATATPVPTEEPKATATPVPTEEPVATPTPVPTEEPVAKFEFPRVQKISYDEIENIKYDGIFFAVKQSKGNVEFYENGDTIHLKADVFLFMYSPIKRPVISISLDDKNYVCNRATDNVIELGVVGENGTYECHVKVEDRENSDLSYEATVTVIIEFN